MKHLFVKLGTAFSASVVVTEAINLDVLWNALITLAVSVLSVLAVEGVDWLRKYIVSKIRQINSKDDKSDPPSE